MELRPSYTEKILCPCLTSLNSCEANEINKEQLLEKAEEIKKSFI